MKKYYFFKITALLIFLAAFAVSCSEEKDANEPIIDNESEYGIFDGIRVLQWYVEDGELIVPLKTNRTVELGDIIPMIEANHPNIEVDIRNIDSKPCMVINVPGLDKAQLPLTFHINVREANQTRSEEPTEHTLTVALRSKNLSTSHDDLYNYDCIRDALGCGMSVVEEIGGTNKKSRIFDFDQIYQYLADRDFSGHDGTTYTTSYEITGSDYKETTRQYSFNLGINGSRNMESRFSLLDGKTFQGSFDMALDFNSHATEYFEYHIFLTLARRKSIKLSGFMDYSSERLVGYLSQSANDVLNNPASEEYKSYPNTKEGIYALYDRFGTHVMTSCIWGGRFNIIYFRKQNAYLNSTASSFALHMGIKKNNNSINSDHPLGSWIVSKMTQTGLEGDLGMNTYAEDIQETTEEQSFVISIGGNANTDPILWEESMETANATDYALIALDEPATENGANSGGLISLSCLCLDGLRQYYLNLYYDEYIKDRALTPDQKTGMVLADVIMVKDDNNGSGGIDPTQQRVMTDAFGKKRLYTPLYVNEYGNADLRGQAVETSNSHYITVSDACDQYWYAAVDWPSECNGISEICISDKDENTLFADGWTRRGNRADSDMNWPNIDNNYLCVKFIPDGDTDTQRVTGFGLAFGDSENDITTSNLKWTDIFCSSVGTEMRFPFATDTNFPYHWKDFTYSTYSKQSWWGDTSAMKRTNPYAVYTLTPMRDLLKPELIGMPTGNGW